MERVDNATMMDAYATGPDTGGVVGASSAIAQIHARVPDPLKPLLSHRSGNASPGKLVQRQYERRAEILSAARAQIAEGRREINVKRLAQSCDLAVQTVYNILGDRDNILLTAIEEHYTAILSAAAAPDQSLDPMSALAEALWAFAWRNPAYVQSLLLGLQMPDHSVSRLIRSHVRRAIASTLQRLDGDGAMDESRVHIHVDRINALIQLSSSEWMHGRVGLTDLRARLLDDFDFALNGIRHNTGAKPS